MNIRRYQSSLPDLLRAASVCGALSLHAPAADFAPTVANPSPPPGEAPQAMVWIPGGEFSMGSDNPRKMRGECMGKEPMEDARPIHRVAVDGFWMDRTEVTNAQFERFVKATGYVTVAEQKPTAEEFPGAPPEALKAGSIVFTPPPKEVSRDNFLAWWSYVPGANWRHPLGPASDLKGREHYPVVHICYEDALAYAKWAHKRLPTEAEWEFAARGGLSGEPFAWGKEFRPSGKWMANTFQGEFPAHDEGSDGFTGLAPVAQFPPNGYGLYDMSGNAWEWCSDWYRPDYYRNLGAYGALIRNPQGPADSYDPAEPGVPKRIQRGGSFLCSEQYCARYMVGTRGKGEPRSSANHIGFRCVQDASSRTPASSEKEPPQGTVFPQK